MMDMSFPKVLALQTGVPETCYPQEMITDFYVHLLGVQGKRRERAIRAVMNHSGVACRYSIVEAEFFESPKSTQQRNERYMAAALPLGAQVIRAGLETAGIRPEQIDTLITVSCTGFNVPGLDLLLARELGMSHHLNRACIFGMGCYGAFPGIKRALESVKAGSQLALVLCLELCTPHLQFDDATESVVSTSLFADGAGMMLIGGDSTSQNGPTLIDSETFCDYQTLDHMSFTLTDEGFRMYLSSYVPDLLAANVREFADRLLERNGLRCEDVRFWAIHPGSKRIVEDIQEKLDLSNEQVSYSLETLHDYGNMSSATVLFVLDRIMQSGQPQPGDYGVMMAFGPGLTMESMLLRW
jgi:predicted naringenin-chalcone synthase